MRTIAIPLVLAGLLLGATSCNVFWMQKLRGSARLLVEKSGSFCDQLENRH